MNKVADLQNGELSLKSEMDYHPIKLSKKMLGD